MSSDPDAAEALEALTLLRANDYSPGPQWKKAHEIAQAHEGEAVFDHIHAIVHRIEGDEGNARYWYHRAGIEPSEASIVDELEALSASLS
ncbi:hypothetical protein [Notoacmeibacter ruber]|uniref:Uncharacterized protein n=1 Tax=Notoacmeibacter ruber TaxID=2670375 RepID=A0A3L7JAG0_9HYPH|nr:hypothetical protein [Notoacmeibacter ruber]RLQ87728.1 hypothetical protein D8780_05415 [Notoacmeibacter ruber]